MTTEQNNEHEIAQRFSFSDFGLTEEDVNMGALAALNGYIHNGKISPEAARKIAEVVKKLKQFEKSEDPKENNTKYLENPRLKKALDEAQEIYDKYSTLYYGDEIASKAACKFLLDGAILKGKYQDMALFGTEEDVVSYMTSEKPVPYDDWREEFQSIRKKEALLSAKTDINVNSAVIMPAFGFLIAAPGEAVAKTSAFLNAGSTFTGKLGIAVTAGKLGLVVSSAATLIAVSVITTFTASEIFKKFCDLPKVDKFFEKINERIIEQNIKQKRTEVVKGAVSSGIDKFVTNLESLPEPKAAWSEFYVFLTMKAENPNVEFKPSNGFFSKDQIDRLNALSSNEAVEALNLRNPYAAAAMAMNELTESERRLIIKSSALYSKTTNSSKNANVLKDEKFPFDKNNLFIAMAVKGVEEDQEHRRDYGDLKGSNLFNHLKNLGDSSIEKSASFISMSFQSRLKEADKNIATNSLIDKLIFVKKNVSAGLTNNENKQFLIEAARRLGGESILSNLNPRKESTLDNAKEKIKELRAKFEDEASASTVAFRSTDI